MKASACLLLLMNLLGPLTAFARLPEFAADNSAADWTQVEGHFLVLNGQGIYSFFIFKIYEISLFLETRSGHSQEVLDSMERKQVVLRFLRGVSANRIRTALWAGFRENCENQCNRLQSRIDQISAQMTDFKAGDRLVFQFLPSKILLKSELGTRLELSETALNRILLSIWLGSNPVNSELKRRLLGMAN